MVAPKCSNCPKGKYMFARCNDTSDTVCNICPRNTFIDEENTLKHCRPCRTCTSNSNMETEKECKEDRNTECKCKQGYYCSHKSESQCDNCSPVSLCPLGEGVACDYTFQKDTVCIPCPKGTYSDVEDYVSRCKNHTSCDDLGRHVKVPGTSQSDVVCGQFKAPCPWMLPASLWAGFVITSLIILLILFLIYWRYKRQPKRSEISLNHISPVLPPDILNRPADCDVEKHAECELTHFVSSFSPDMDSMIQSDGLLPTLTVSEKYRPSDAANEYTDSITYHSNYQSEPQESEWND